MDIVYELDSLVQQFVSIYPSTRVGNRLRKYYYGNKFREGGKNNIFIFSNVHIEKPSNITIGNNVYINRNCLIDASDADILIGDNVLIGPYSILRGSNHIFSEKDIPIYQQGHSYGEIVLEDDVWLGANVKVMPDVTIGKGSVIGAGAVVTKDIEPYSVAVGVPARKIKNRGE